MKVSPNDWQQTILAAPDLSVARAVATAIQTLLTEDSQLLSHNANERTITGALAGHLKPQFPGWHVDPEYNRDGHSVKTLSGERVIPDVIVHHRGTPENLLAIEVKKSNSREHDEVDLEKLHLFRSELHYQFAMFIKFSVPVPGVETVLWI